MTPAPALAAWPTNTQAAVQLGTNERTIRRWIAAGRLRAEQRPVVGAKPQTVIDPEDVARVRAEREREKPVVIADPDRMPDAMPHVRIGGEVARVEPFGSPAWLKEIAAISAELQTINRQSSSNPKTWLTAKEAALASGLPESWLRDFARDASKTADGMGPQVDIEVLDVGAGRRGGRYRFRRDSL